MRALTNRERKARELIKRVGRERAIETALSNMGRSQNGSIAFWKGVADCIERNPDLRPATWEDTCGLHFVKGDVR